MDKKFLYFSAKCDFDQFYGNTDFYKKVGYAEDADLITILKDINSID
jgi:hypothetical protein